LGGNRAEPQLVVFGSSLRPARVFGNVAGGRVFLARHHCGGYNLSLADRRAYLITDNRLAELAGWDRELLATELQGWSIFNSMTSN
jgi:hypothetical protein